MDHSYIGKRVSSYFGENTFGFAAMREKLPPDTMGRLQRAIQQGGELEPDVAESVAQAMRDWAISRGATSYTHWFQPLTGLTAEKHDSFLAWSAGGGVVEEFTGSCLVKSEPDASSFPHGGMRSTFEARGYAAWDPSSPAFLMEGEYGRTLFIPSVFVSHDGHVLDKKTPLLKSIRAVSEAAMRLLKVMGHEDVEWVHPLVGAEQEYFLVDRDLASQRPDLQNLGYTIFGARAPRGQQFEDHYFGAIKDRVLGFMQELELELFRLGIPAKTRHNEVAPNQFEMATLPETANVAADHNQLIMEMMRRVARRHNFTVLLHEKPFYGINGSGKHNNWSLVTSRGVNLYKPGKTEKDNLCFLCAVTAILFAVKHHGALMRGIISGPGNDFRLGMHEAPPAIMSVYLGDELSRIFSRLEDGDLPAIRRTSEFRTGVPFIPPFPADVSDRNRTSPMAFTGNKFEFRAVGSSASIAMPNTVLNSAVAQGLHHLADSIEVRLKSGEEIGDAILGTVRECYRECSAVHFNGDNYTDSWREEAARRGLPIATNTPEALVALTTPASRSLFSDLGVLTPDELEARRLVKQDIYTKTIEMELRVARDMLRTLILPAGLEYQKMVSSAAGKARDLFGSDDPDFLSQKEYVRKISGRIRGLAECVNELDELHDRISAMTGEAELAVFCATTVRPVIGRARKLADELESRVDARCWRIPRYCDLLTLS